MPHDLFHTVLIFPILNVLVGLYKLFLTLHLPGAFGLAIVALVVLIRLLLHPFFKKQIETAKKMQTLKPQLDKLSLQHKGNPKQLQAEQMKLYQEAGINPATGCLFMIVQIPVFIGLYNTLSLFLSHGTGSKMIADINNAMYAPLLHITKIDPHFLGFNLVMSPKNAHIWYYYLVPVVTGLLQYYQTKVSLPASSPSPVVKNAQGEVIKKSDTAGDFQSAMNTQMKYLFPVMIGYFSYTLPVGLALYWNIFSLFSIMQYRLVHQKVDPVITTIESTEEAKLLEKRVAQKKGKNKK